MQKKCPQSCCQRGEYKPPREQEERTFMLCDAKNNIFNDDFTPPPLNAWDEMLANEVNCDNYYEIKVKIDKFHIHSKMLRNFGKWNWRVDQFN